MDLARRLVVEADDGYAAVGSGRVGADVAESPVERDQQPAIVRRAGQHVRVVGAFETFRVGGVGVVAGVGQRRSCRARQVLVELDPHEAATAGYSSRASSAP